MPDIDMSSTYMSSTYQVHVDLDATWLSILLSLHVSPTCPTSVVPTPLEVPKYLSTFKYPHCAPAVTGSIFRLHCNCTHCTHIHPVTALHSYYYTTPLSFSLPCSSESSAPSIYRYLSTSCFNNATAVPVPSTAYLSANADAMHNPVHSHYLSMVTSYTDHAS